MANAPAKKLRLDRILLLLLVVVGGAAAAYLALGK
jgi:hypothetical protein